MTDHLAPTVAAPPLRALLIGQGSDPGFSTTVEIRHWRSIDVALPSGLLGRPLEAFRRGLAELDTSPLIWADVLVMRNWYATVCACLSCPVASLEEAVLVEHCALSGHEWRRPHEGLVRALIETIDRRPGVLRGSGLVYVLDADPWAIAAGEGGDGGADHPGLALELDLVRLLLRSADVVVAATPEAAVAARREGSHENTLVVVPPTADHRARPDAWLRAAARPGSGRLLGAGAPATVVARTAAESAQRRDRRNEICALDEAAAATMAERHASGLPSWNEADAIDPLVSVVIPTVDESSEAIERAIRSALDTVGVRIEVVVAGLPDSGAEEAVRRSGDPRVRFVEIGAASGAADLDPAGDAWRCATWATATAAANDAARGTWLAPLEPSSVWVPGHIATLLAVAIEHGLEVVYGATLLVRAGEVVGQVGSWPPAAESIAHDAALITAGLRAISPDPESWRDGDDPTWNLWRRYVEIGVRMGNIEEPVTLRDAPDGDAVEDVAGSRVA
jgi:hypothetical protein